MKSFQSKDLPPPSHYDDPGGPPPTPSPQTQPLPAIPYSTVLTVERRVSHESMGSLDGNHYSVPDTTRKRVVEV